MLIFILYTFDISLWKTQSSFEENFGSLAYISFTKRARVFLGCLNLVCTWLAGTVAASECDWLVRGVAYPANKKIELFILIIECLDSLDVSFLWNHYFILFREWFLLRKLSWSLRSDSIYHYIMVWTLLFQFERSLPSKLSNFSSSVLSLPSRPAANMRRIWWV